MPVDCAGEQQPALWLKLDLIPEIGIRAELSHTKEATGMHNSSYYHAGQNQFSERPGTHHRLPC